MKDRIGKISTPSHLESSPVWGGFQRGDLVRVRGRSGTFKFMGHVKNLRSNEEWVAVYGGSSNPNANRQFSYVLPSKLRAVPAKRSREAS